MNYCTSHNNWNLENYLITMAPALTHEITSIIMDEEKHVLHNWESQNIIAKTKDMGIEQLVNETILTYRNILVFQLIRNLQQEILEKQTLNNEILQDIRDYNSLKVILNKLLGRVTSNFF